MKVNKFRQLSKDVIFISKITKVTKKKIRLILSVALSNITVLADILIILVFASLLSPNQNQESVYYFLISIILNNLYLLPILVIFRTLIVLLEKVNIHSLQLQVEKIYSLNINQVEIYKELLIGRYLKI